MILKQLYNQYETYREDIPVSAEAQLSSEPHKRQSHLGAEPPTKIQLE